jgi:endogenous inhibitor of DNA gyrase (YacG/DUF329 family)
MKAAEYTCARCKGTFLKGWTDEQASAEREQLFPSVPLKDCVEICDDCFRDIVPLCPVCGQPALERAWCSAECEAFDETGQRP